ncbi:hypothetical protein [Bacillus benzoevorans]|uniref:Uncharacterized protein n=1 Tax=Bacillus benzoevorans TaxID=1456 RepID=A0A7X0HW06_9BACI|nr:hypothetical protein [Bacillus benzoevorans]MBB6447796.1 hypothetical protein [Bacillus benzoevorans]
MQIEIAKMERMSERGSSLLRLIQNSHTPLLDLLIRESVQNSLDAAKDQNSPIKYDISVKTFLTQSVTRHFKGIEQNLIRKFPSISYKSLVIRDWNTTGLTGPLHQDYISNNQYGNLLKLVYEISMPQEKKEAGGSWGLGKTVYFRAGIGLVVYYSRIKLDEGGYQSRLAACLVEDESKDDALLPDDQNHGLKRGIAWWGQPHNDESTKPVTNEKQINEILQAFNVNPFIEDETGTAIIIPFINESKLISTNDENKKTWWHTNIELYLNIALQRWYAPRIDNQYYKYGNYLEPSVNGDQITKETMEPVFSIINTLYTVASSDLIKPGSRLIDKKDINVKEVEIHRTLNDKSAGKVAFVKVNRDQLKMNVPDNKKSPFEYLDLQCSEDTNSPIVAYLRKPAMIVNFETEGKWTNGIDRTNSDEFIIAVFVPNSENLVTSLKNPISLEEYLRMGEKADHSSWNDIVLEDRKYTIVQRIQTRVASSIKEAYTTEDDKAKLSRSGALSKSLALLLLPPKGFGKSPNPGTKKPVHPDGNIPRRKGGKLHIVSTELENDGSITIDFEIVIPKDSNSFEIEIQVESEGNKKISGNEWEDEIGTRFPIEIKGIFINDSAANNGSKIIIDQLKTEKYGINHHITFQLNGFEGELSGKIKLSNYDPMVQASIRENLLMFKEVHK